MNRIQTAYQCLLTVLFAAGIFTCFPVNGQVFVPGPEDVYNEAEEYVFAGDYMEALPLYLNLYEKGHSTANISYKIGTCYLNLPGLKTKAIPFLRDAVQMASGSYSGVSLAESNAPVKALLYLGIAYRVNYDFIRAESALIAFIDSLDDSDMINTGLARYHIDKCKHARELIAAPVLLQIDTLPDEVNNFASNFNPLVTDDEKLMYFNEQYKFYDAVMTTVREDGTWEQPENITPRIKSDGDHKVTGISIDGNQLLLSAYDAYLSGEIYMTEQLNGRWTRIQPLNSNVNTRFNETHASLSKDGNTLFFTSDRPGGYGGLDIYMSKLDETGDWGSAINLGPLVNTPYNEESPFIAYESGYLYFSSQGHYNMGGYDIFCAGKTDNGNWQYPVNIGYPINTPDDDLFYYPLPSGEAAYKSVFKRNTADLDIIRYHILEPGNPERYTINGVVAIQDSTGSGHEGIHVSIVNYSDNDTIAKQLIDRSGLFEIKVPSGSFLLEISDNDSVLFFRNLEIPSWFPRHELIVNANISMPAKVTGDTVLIRDVLFDFDQSEPAAGSISVITGLVEVMLKYPGIDLVLNGYTDAIGSETYNMRLSLERAGNTRDFLLKHGILEDRISVNGYGESNPVAINSTPSGADIPEGRSFNRRVEIILEKFPDSLIIIKEDPVPEDLLAY